MKVRESILRIPLGYSEVRYQNRTYGVVRTDFNQGKSIKVFAKALGGTDFISFNYYLTKTDEHLKLREMPRQKVMDFLLNKTL